MLPVTDAGQTESKLVPTVWEVRVKVNDTLRILVRSVPFESYQQHEELRASLQPNEELSLVYM